MPWAAVVLLGCVSAGYALLRRLSPAAAPRRLLACGVLLASGVGFWRPQAGTPSAAPAGLGVQPLPAAQGYANSGACRSCHPSEHQSWYASFHRSMTELATDPSVRSPWNGTRLELEGRSYRLFRRDGEFWVELDEPDRLADGAHRGVDPGPVPRVERRVLMTTGSHHYQGYWVSGQRGNELWQVPFVYHFESQRFLPRRAVFLEPPTDPPVWARWNSSCIQCHSVAGQPRHDLASDRFDTRAAELGIACEACHGPGAEHVSRQQNPLTRFQTRRSSQGDPSIVNPARLGAERASEVCGQCHAYFVPTDAERWWHTGFSDSYRPGEVLSASRRVLDYERDRAQAQTLVGADLDSLFYADGSVRVGGREYNGLSSSACFERGRGKRQLSCLSCHRLHGGTREDQLSPEAQSNAACEHCHTDVQPLSAHTHHPEASSGSACVNCHMPYTSYALLGSVRSHRITSPSVDTERAGLPLNACNSCHLDRSLPWTAHWLALWYGRAPRPAGSPPSPPAIASVAGGSTEWSAAAVALLSGDAATRVVAAHQMGWAPAQQASGRNWQAQLLMEALDDAYAAVRFAAHRSLRTLPGFAGFEYDFIADPRQRSRQLAAARRIFERQLAQLRGELPAADLPLDSAGRISPEFLAALARRRDDRPVRIAE